MERERDRGDGEREGGGGPTLNSLSKNAFERCLSLQILRGRETERQTETPRLMEPDPDPDERTSEPGAD